ncbi:MAG: radical SAM protein, partial [Lachnospiraceae bacterium]|nr:radical SAM protein [Lachnospiraceae bacterium]
LYYYGQLLSEISIEMQPEWNERLTQNGIPYRKIAYLSTDRLRIKHESICIFKSQEHGCYFCNVPKSTSNHLFMMEDFSEVIHELFVDRKFRHILIGGASAPEEREIQQILFITQLIRNEDAFIPIYLMCLPPSNKDTLKRYKDAGITEVAFNIEIWDRKLAEILMPGKGKIPLEVYMDALIESTKLWGKSGNVRTALIVGLNNTDSLLEAIETLCKHGIQPMLSIFRPMENTKLYPIVPPSNEKLLDIYNHAQIICEKYGLKLGPSCDACKNNMLA